MFLDGMMNTLRGPLGFGGIEGVEVVIGASVEGAAVEGAAVEGGAVEGGFVPGGATG